MAILILIPSVAFASQYTIKSGDTPYKVFGANWKEAMQSYFGHSNPYRLPVNAIVDPVGWKPQQLGFRSPQETQTSPTRSTETKLADETVVTPDGDNTLTNGGFELGNLSSWTTTSVSGLNFAATTTATSGVYSAEMTLTTTTDITGSPAGLIEQAGGPYTAGTDLNIKFDLLAGADNSASTTVAILFTNGSYANSLFDELYNFTTGVWDTTVTVDSDHSANFGIGTGITTSTWTNYDWNTLVGLASVLPVAAPASGTINIVQRIDGNENDIVMLDNVQIYSNTTSTVVAATPITPDLFTNSSDYSLIDATDNFCLFRTNGGATSTCMIGFDGLSDLIINKSQVCTKWNMVTNATSSVTCL